MPNPLAQSDLDEIIATHRALFGGFTMQAEPDQAPASTPSSPEPAVPAATARTADQPSVDTTDWKKLAEDARAALKTSQEDAEKWKGLSRKHERRQLEALGFDPEAVDKIIAEQKTNPKAVADKVAGYDDLAKRLDELEKDRDAARAEADVAKAIATYHVSEEDSPLLVGLSGDKLIGLAKRLGQTAKAPAAPSLDGAGKVGGPVSGPKQIATREEYAALSPEERRAARKDGRLNKLLGITS